MNKRKLIRQLRVKIPAISWDILLPSSKVIKDFGNGFLLRGSTVGKSKEFFILDDDKTPTKWALVIAHYLDSNLVSEEIESITHQTPAK
jgi:hypothetical protein